MEKESECENYITEFRLFSNQICRWLSTDRVKKADINPYNSFSNSPIVKIDPLGLSDYYTQKGEYLGSDGTDGTDIHVVTDKETIKMIKKNRIPSMTDKTYYFYTDELKPGTYFTLPPQNERQQIKDEMSNQKDDQRKEIGGTGYKADGGASYYARAVDGTPVEDDELIKLFKDNLVNTEGDYRGTGSIPEINTKKAANRAELDKWKSSVINPRISYTWHSHPFIQLYAVKNPVSGTFDITIGSILALKAKTLVI